MLCDMHTHSSYSPDADREVTVERMVRRARELGLGHIALTDHCDCNYWYREDETEYPEYQKPDSMMFGARDYAVSSIREAASLAEGYPELICGIELGQPLQAPEAAAGITKMPGLDFVIGSLHMNAGKPDFYWIEYDKLDSKELDALLTDYFTELLKMCRGCDFDILGHLTYPLRYIEGKYGIPVDMSSYGEVIREIFCTLIQRGKGIEINTSGLRQEYGKTFPTLEYVKLYRSLGGELLTLGSDAHRLCDIGAGLEDGAELAREAGFKYTAVFRGRKPRLIPL
ncbi:MAG: histidinol-phosphatase HisJ family protein [Ruminococcus sp.]|nr:histidinol-phosphatase HisJ family protein [Ruminococcus sp.]